MTNIPKQTDYWLKTAEEDFGVGSHLIKAGKIRHGLFFINLALEKILKANICKNLNKTPPKIHNLMDLYRLAGLKPDVKRQEALEVLNRFCLEGRYPEQWLVIPGKEEAQRYLKMSENLMEWLKKQL